MDKLLAISTFVRIVDKGSLTAAAHSLDTSLPTVVRTLAALERDLGVRLLNRTTRRIHLTVEGAQYIERCRTILSAIQESETSMTSAQDEPRGRLAVTSSVLFGRRFIAPIVSEYLRRHAGVSADLLFVDRNVNLVEEGIDVAVRIGHLSDSSLVAVRVGEVRRVICASPQYLRRRGVPKKPADIASHACVRHTGLAPRSEWNFRVGRRNAAVAVNAIMTCNEIDSALTACVQGIGLGMFLSYQTAPARKTGELKYVLENFETEPLPVHVVYPHARLMSARVRTFVDECAKKLRLGGFD